MRGNPHKNQTGRGASYRFGRFELHPGERQLLADGQPVALAPKAFDGLLLFVRHAEQLVHRNAIHDALWPDTFVSDTNLTNLIVGLRKVLGHDAIQTVSKHGYRFCLPVLGEPGIAPATYDRFLQARQLAARRSFESMSEARDLLSLCVAEQPDFAAAWAWLGRCARFLHKFKGGTQVHLELAQAALRRALAIDPDLACAHNFYTPLQVDLGESRAAALRLIARLARRGNSPDDYAGLVQALRCCGMLDASVAAHERAIALDAAMTTSVPHTFFLRGDYQQAIETYRNTHYYLDAAAWAALGQPILAASLLKTRLGEMTLSPLMHTVMASLLAVLEETNDTAVRLMRSVEAPPEPEVSFYLARHWAMLGDVGEAVSLLARARGEGLTSSWTLQHDPVFAASRSDPRFQHELALALDAEAAARLAFEGAAGPWFASLTAPAR